MAKHKKKNTASKPAESSESVLHWYEQAGRQGLLEQKPKKKEEKDSGNRLDASELDKLAAFKKTLVSSEETAKKEAAAAARKKAREEERNTHWFELAEKQGFLDQ